MRHILAGFLIACCACLMPAAEEAAVAATSADLTSVDEMIKALNPAQRVDIRDTNMLWGDPVSSIGQKIQFNTWLAVLIFLPFLIVPQILLVYVIVKFKDRKDGRKPAKFVGHHTLEFWWTVIPIIVLIIVSFPMVSLLYEQELPPEDVHTGEAMEVRITGKKFNWVYDYPEQKVAGLNMFNMQFTPEIEGTKDTINVNLQEPAVFEKGRVTTLFFQSLDVTHAWGVPALAVKKDCFVDRVTHSWFDSKETGFFEGQCYELCGADHGYMIVTAAVVEPEQFNRWVKFMHYRDDANEVVGLLRTGDANQVAEAVKAYFRQGC